MRIDIGCTDKRLNSTSNAFTKVYENIDVKLKEPTSITRPQFLLKLQGPADIHKCNYLHYTKWGYYWIDDIIVETNDLVTLICRRDVLASFKTEIGSTCSYVNYTSTLDTYNHLFEQDDPRLSPDLLYKSHAFRPFENEGLFDLEDGCVIVQTLAFVSSDSGGYAGINTYIMLYTEFINMATACADEILDEPIEDLTRLLLGSDVKSNILSARYVPFSFHQIAAWYPNNLTTDVCLGGFSVTVGSAVVFTSQSVIRNIQKTGLDLFEDTPLHNEYKFLRGSKYTSVQLVHPCGNLDLSSDDLITSSSISLVLSVDLTCGDYSIGVWPAEGNSYPIINGTFATDWTRYITNMSNPNTAVKIKSLKAIGTLGAAYIGAGGGGTLAAKTLHRVASSAQGESLARGVTGICGAIENSYNTGRSYNNASSGGITNTYAMSSIYDPSREGNIVRIEYTTYIPHVMRQDYYSADHYPSYAQKYGYPYFADAKINDLEGYVQCAGFCYLNYNTQPPDVHRSATAVEIAEINSLLNSGIYYE